MADRLRMPGLAAVHVKAIAVDLGHAFAAQIGSERLGVVDYARTIVLADGDRKGDFYDPALHPGQLCLLQAIDGGASWIACAKPVQDGGSLATSVPLLRRVSHLHQSVMVAFPTGDKAKDVWTTKLWPMIEAQGGMQPEKGGGSRGGAARVVELPGGGRFNLRSSGGRGESGQASDTVDALQVEEVDDWTNLGRIRLIERRISKSPDPLLLYVSTVKRDGKGPAGSHILRLFEMGSGTTLRYPCPHCGLVQRFEWENVDVEREVLICMDCKKSINEQQRQVALRRWTRHDARRTPMFSILWTALDSPFPIVVNGTRQPVLTGLCAEYRQAKDAIERGDHSLMRAFEHDRLVRMYFGDEQADEDGTLALTHQVLAERSKLTTWSEVGENKDEGGLWSRYFAEWPEEAAFSVAAIDVQDNRVYWEVTGFATDERSFDLGWGLESARPGTAEGKPPPWGPGELRAVLNRVADYLAAQLGSKMRVGLVDTGDEPERLEEFLRENPNWRGVRGVDKLPIIKLQGPSDYEARVEGLVCWERRWKPGLGRYIVSSEAGWRAFQGAYRRPSGTAGAAHLPGPLRPGNFYLRHLTSWGDVKNRNGVVVWRKMPGGGRNDLGDCRCYTQAVGLALLRAKPEPPPDTGPGPADLLNDPFFRRLN